MEEVNSFSIKKLSMQQKAILEVLAKNKRNIVWVSYISWEIARKFNKTHNDRIWTLKGQERKEAIKLEKEIKENALTEDQIKARRLSLSFADLFRTQSHRKKEKLTPKHRASFSRSLKELNIRRGLIECITHYNKEGIVYGIRTNYVFLTDKGKKACELLGFLNLETKLVDIHKKFGNSFDVYIGRRQPFTKYTKNSKWANPYLMDKIKNGKIIKKRDGTAKEVVEKYRKHVLNNEVLMNDLPELKGKILGCWCKNQEWYKEGLCHGDVLIELLQLRQG